MKNEITRAFEVETSLNGTPSSGIGVIESMIGRVNIFQAGPLAPMEQDHVFNILR